MSNAITALCKRTLANIGHLSIFERLRRGRITIPMYHGVIDRQMTIPDWCMLNVDAFRAQINFLKNNYRLVTLSEAEQLIKENSVTEPTAVVTFDDGYQNNYDVAYPVLKEANVPATLFLSTTFVDTDQTIWTGMLHSAFSQTAEPALEWKGTTFKLTSIANKVESLAAVKSILKTHPQDTLLDDVNTIVLSLNGGQPLRVDRDSPYRMLDSKSLFSLVNSGLIELGAHTHNHYVLSRIPAAVQETEITRSLDIVKSFTGQPCRIFAYPNGTLADYNSDTISILQNAGVTAAVTTEVGLCSAKSPLLEMPRIPIGNSDCMQTFRLSMINLSGSQKSAVSSRAY